MPISSESLQLVSSYSDVTAHPLSIEAEYRPDCPKPKNPKRDRGLPPNFRRHLRPSEVAKRYAASVGVAMSDLERLAAAGSKFTWKLGDAPLGNATVKAIRADSTLPPKVREDKLKRLTAELKASAKASFDALRVEAISWVERVNAFEESEEERRRVEAAEARAYELGVQNVLREFRTYRNGAGGYKSKNEVFGCGAVAYAQTNAARQRNSRMRAGSESRAVRQIFKEAGRRPAKPKGKHHAD